MSLWKPRGRLPWLIAAAILLAGAAYALGAGQPKAPPLTNAYGSLEDHWAEVAAAVGADPGQTYLNSWNLTYGPGGTVQELSMDFIVQEPSGYTWYKYNQAGTDRPRLKGSNGGDRRPPGPAPARIFFEELDAAGLQALEAHSGQEPPVRIRADTVYSNGSTYGQQVGAHAIANGAITPAGPEGIPLRGHHIRLVIGRNDTGSKPNLLYVVPAAVAP